MRVLRDAHALHPVGRPLGQHAVQEPLVVPFSTVTPCPVTKTPYVVPPVPSIRWPFRFTVMWLPVTLSPFAGHSIRSFPSVTLEVTVAPQESEAVVARPAPACGA